MKKGKIYYSALQNEQFSGEDIDEFKCDNGLAFKNNLCINQPLFKDVDVIYSEPSWRQGYSIFKKRANVNTNDNFNNYVNAISIMIRQYKCHRFILCGKHFEKRLLPPTDSKDVKLWGYKARLLSYGTMIPTILKIETNTDIINFIGKRYNCVYDFSCGYSELLLSHFYNKRFYLSDIQGKCIDFIKKRYNKLKKDEKK